MVQDERLVVGWLAGLDSMTGKLAFNLIEHSCYLEFFQCARQYKQGDEITLWGFNTDADIGLVFQDNHELLLKAAEIEAHKHNTNRLKWLAELDYPSVPKDQVLAVVQKSIIDGEQTDYDNEVRKVFVHKILSVLFEDFTC